MAGITVRGLTLGTGEKTAKIILPIPAQSVADACEKARALRALPGDMAELRLDGVPGGGAGACECLTAVREILPQYPLLATVRTRREGGAADLTPERYTALLQALLQTGAADLLDVELSAGATAAQALVQAARAAGVYTVFSSHDFAKTPPVAEMAARLAAMGAAGADIAKLAVMPHSPADAAALLQATALAAQRMPNTPLITMAMGAHGAITRACGFAFGSVATFGSAGQASAPGQPDAKSLRRALDALAECL